jgi:hypothetical protein
MNPASALTTGKPIIPAPIQQPVTNKVAPQALPCFCSVVLIEKSKPLQMVKYYDNIVQLDFATFPGQDIRTIF